MQKKINQIEEDNIQDQNNFFKEIKTLFSDKSKIADAKCKIETLKSSLLKKQSISLYIQTTRGYQHCYGLSLRVEAKEKSCIS